MAVAIETLPRNTPPPEQTVVPAPPPPPRPNNADTPSPVVDRVTLSPAAAHQEPPVPAEPRQESLAQAIPEPIAGTNRTAAAAQPQQTQTPVEQTTPPPPEPAGDQTVDTPPPAVTAETTARPAPPSPVAPPEPAVSPAAAAPPETPTPPEAPPVPAEEALLQNRREELRQQAFAAMTPVSTASHVPRSIQPLDVTI